MNDTETATTVVTAPASLDMYTVHPFRAALHDAIGHGATFLVADLNGVEWMDSLGCGTLVAAMRRAEAHDCRFGIACSQPSVLRLFLMLGLTKVFDIRPSVEEFSGEKGAQL